MATHYQYIIIGAGCAGLQLAKALLQLPIKHVQSILLIDATAEHEEKSWCFWQNAFHPNRHLVKKEWSNIEFITDNLSISQSIQPKTYQYINSLDFYNDHIAYFKTQDRITIINDCVIAIEPQGKQVLVNTLQQPFTCNYVFYTNPILGNSNYTKTNTWQHFLGWVIETDSPIFNVDTARMMDFSVDNTTDIQFVYVLPFSNNKALVECTIFSSEVALDATYEATLQAYIEQKFNCNYQITAKEKGKIPMQLYQKPTLQHPNIIPIGSAAGCIKPSTGYSFARAMQHTQEIVAAIQLQQPIDRRLFKPRFAFYDRLFLTIIQDKPQVMKTIFTQLFKHNNIKNILLFLDEKSNLLQDIRIFTRLPKLPFLKALQKNNSQ
jgi:lycopene beta-cyclase